MGLHWALRFGCVAWEDGVSPGHALGRHLSPSLGVLFPPPPLPHGIYTLQKPRKCPNRQNPRLHPGCAGAAADLCEQGEHCHRHEPNPQCWEGRYGGRMRKGLFCTHLTPNRSKEGERSGMGASVWAPFWGAGLNPIGYHLDAWVPLCGIFVHRDESQLDEAGIGGYWGYYLGLIFLCLPLAATQWPGGWGTAGERDAVCPAPLRVPLRPLPDLAPAAERVSTMGMDPCILYPSSPCSSFLSFQRSCQHEGEEQIQVRPCCFAP